MAAIFDGSSFTGYSPSYPVGFGVPPGNTHPVQLILSDGTNQTVFSTLDVALRCLTFMRARDQWFLQPTEDVLVVMYGGCKLFILEATFVNQKLLASFVPTYQGGKTLLVHRSLSQMLSLTDALSSVGYCEKSGAPPANNYDLETNKADADRPRLKVVDYNFIQSPVNSTLGSLLNDPTPLPTDFTA